MERKLAMTSSEASLQGQILHLLEVSHMMLLRMTYYALVAQQLVTSATELFKVYVRVILALVQCPLVIFKE